MLNIEKEKNSSELITEKSVELYGFTPEEKSDENLEWMRKNGYTIKRVEKHRRGTRGRR